MRKLELTRKVYKDIKKKDQQQMNDYMTELYKLGFDDGLALRYSKEDFRNTMADIIFHHEFNEHGCQRNTDGRRNQIPPCILPMNQDVFYEILTPVNHGFQ